jgi:uncharacterized protein (DUF362 family)
MSEFLNKIKSLFYTLTDKPTVMKLSFISVGFASTVWFLVRVIPKPSRAAYPCMRATAPVMSSFVVWLLTLSGSVAAYRKAIVNFNHARFLYAGIFMMVTFSGLILLIGQRSNKAYSAIKAEWIITPNNPIGIAKGIFPGRVVWIHDPAVAKWDGKTGDWWDENVTSQKETDKMIARSITSLTGKKSEKKAWDALFKHFNTRQNKGKQGYMPGQKIAVKINVNNTNGHENSKEINATPQLVLSLLKSLVNEAGVPQNNITVFDASRFITHNIFDKCHAAFPGVIFVDNIGGEGRTKSNYVENAISYSVDNGKLDQGLATCAVDADYLINMALLKGHVGQGVTLCAKNYYGVTSIQSDWRKNAHNNFDQDREGKPKYMTFVDFLAHKDLGLKTMLFFIDGIYGAKLVNGPPAPKWQMAPFSNNWPCSLFASQDPVAIDAVGLDFLRSEFPEAPDMAFSDQYLIEAALANNPPSKTVYDPQRTQTRVSSLGTMEHWNNAREKKYSRNLGHPQGIELVQSSINE